MKSLAPQKSLVDQVYDVILQALSDGTFTAGERITQDDIATRLNVSRQPVTQALAILKAQGFFVPAGKRGLTVTSVKPRFFEEIYQLRSAVEPLAVSLAASRMTQEQVLAGRSIIERGRASVLADSPVDALQADIDFHAFIYEVAGNSLITETMRLHWYHLRRAMTQTLSRPGASIAAWQEHERILDEMASGNSEGAATIMRDHLMGSHRRVKSDPNESRAH